MKAVDPTVRRETAYISLWVLLFSALMQAVFLILRQWNYTVILGNALGACAAIGNFFLMGLTVQSAVSKEQKQAASMMKASQTGRLFLLFMAALLGVLLDCFNIWATIIPLFFPRIAIALRPLFKGFDK